MRHACQKPVKIFNVSNNPKVGHENTKWDHAKDRPLLILDQDWVLKLAQSAQGEVEADGVVPLEESISTPPGHSHAAESVFGAVQGKIVEATTGEEANMKYVTQSQDVEKVVSISHKDLGGQEVLDDLVYEEQDRKGPGEAGEQGELAQDSTPRYGVPCQGDVCHREDRHQVASNIHHGGLDQDERCLSSEDEEMDEDIHSEVPGMEEAEFVAQESTTHQRRPVSNAIAQQVTQQNSWAFQPLRNTQIMKAGLQIPKSRCQGNY